MTNFDWAFIAFFFLAILSVLIWLRIKMDACPPCEYHEWYGCDDLLKLERQRHD